VVGKHHFWGLSKLLRKNVRKSLVHLGLQIA
jgi:hypothetical protein